MCNSNFKIFTNTSFHFMLPSGGLSGSNPLLPYHLGVQTLLR